MSQYICRVQRTTFGSWFSPSVTWIQEIELRFRDDGKCLYLLSCLSGPFLFS